MILEKQVVSLELSKRLKNLGLNQESAFYWIQYRYRLQKEPHIEFRSLETNLVIPDQILELSAFTVAELGEMLPVEIMDGGMATYKKYWENGLRDLHSVGYETPTHRIYLQEFATTEADARAKMLIHLMEQGIVKP